MFKNYFKIAWRNLIKNKAHSFINITGLAIGMTVAMLIGLWIWDELTFDHYDPNYKRVAEVMQSQTFNGVVRTQRGIPVPLGDELRKSYSSDLKYVVMSSNALSHILRVGEKMVSRNGNFIEPDGPEVLGVRMIEGSKDGLSDPSAILLSQSLAKALFGNADPLHRMVRMDNKDNFFVAGVYKDLPDNATFHVNESMFLGSWSYYTHHFLSKDALTEWGDNLWQCFVELTDNADMDVVSGKIRDVRLRMMDVEGLRFKPVLFLHPMSKWHLYSQFRNGKIDGGRIEYVWLFGTIGFFVLLLACINFMNLSTAKSEKRAKEVGIRKTIGAMRGQLIGGFYAESMLIALIAFVLCLGIAWLLLPFFNEVAGKHIRIPWLSPLFWAGGVVFASLTGIIAGSYPALYLSSFRPVKVLKGTFRAGRFAAVPRQVLVVLQFSVSVVLIIGTIVVFKQIQFAKNRPIGYSRNGLVMLELSTDDLHKHFAAVRNDLIGSGTVMEVAESTSPATQVDNNTSAVTWEGKDPTMTVDFATVGVSAGYGRAIGWKFVKGRDFLRQFLTDSNAIVLNEAAVKYMGVKDPVGKMVRLWDQDRLVIGVVKDMIMDSPFESVKQTIYFMSANARDFVNIRIRPDVSPHAAIRAVERVWKEYSPGAPFAYRFVDKAYAIKFAEEEKVGKLAGVFAVLAIFISCLGLFGMASFMAEQRVKEIGVRKVLGASVFHVWGMLSKDFMILVGLALVIALPAGWLFMRKWLQHYSYRTDLAWWIFAAAGLGAIVITVLTVSYQSIRAGMMNPVRALRSE